MTQTGFAQAPTGIDLKKMHRNHLDSEKERFCAWKEVTPRPKHPMSIKDEVQFLRVCSDMIGHSQGEADARRQVRQQRAARRYLFVRTLFCLRCRALSQRR